jgi:hypothetical protein
MTRKRTLVVSDVHLSQTHPDDPSDPEWMRYRRAEHHPDAEFSALIDHVLGSLDAGDQLEIVFNGDVLDFDAPWVKDGASSFDEYPIDDAGCAAQATRILVDHPGWFGAAAKAITLGHRVLFLSGNHDLELFWPGVRAAIRAHFVALCAAQGHDVEAVIDERLRFRAWFHRTEDGIYLEHGSQYDIFNGMPWPMMPMTRDRRFTYPVMGKLAFKRTGSRMGYFNPYYEETFYMGFLGYGRHFLEHYAFKRRHIARTWLFGGIATVLDVWRQKHTEDWTDESRARAVGETGAEPAKIDATNALRADFAERTMVPILRELWLDRLFEIALFIVLVGGAAAIAGGRGAAIAAGALAVLFTIYEVLMPKPDIRTYDSAPAHVKQLLDIHDARAMCFGHTHRPFEEWDERGRLYGNSGTWCPAFKDAACTIPVLTRRPLLLLTTEGEKLEGGLFWWKDGALEPEAPLKPSDLPGPRAEARGTYQKSTRSMAM